MSPPPVRYGLSRPRDHPRDNPTTGGPTTRIRAAPKQAYVPRVVGHVRGVYSRRRRIQLKDPMTVAVEKPHRSDGDDQSTDGERK